MTAPRGTRWLLGAVVLAGVTLAMLALRTRLEKAHVAMIYLLVVLLGTASGGRTLGFTLAGAAFVLFNWFFLLPYGTLRIGNPLDWLVLVTFLAVSATTAQMLYRLQREAVLARRRADEVNQFAVIGAETLNAARPQAALDAIADTIREALHLDRCSVTGLVPAASGTDPLVIWTLERGLVAERLADGTSHLTEGVEPARHAGEPPVAVFVPLRVRDRTVGVLHLAAAAGVSPGDAERRFLRAMSYYAALGIERTRLAGEADRAEGLREADRLKDALLASVSHDLRTPLTTIKTLAHEMRSKDDRALTIEEEADRLNRLVADLLDLSRLQGNALPLHIELNAVDDLLGALVQRTRGALGDRTLDIRLPDGGTLLVGRFDLAQSLRVLVNLVENAAKYSPPGPPITVSVERIGGRLRIAVADRGPGVPMAERERIFEAFYRPANAVADSGSSGLGLAIARGLAEAQQGTLTYRDREGNGSVFTLELLAADLPAHLPTA